MQPERAEPVAKTLFPLGARLNPEPWLDARPCTPDMLPIITGGLVAEMVTGATPFTDPKPYRANRF
jgi:D-amino-acid dehydrogenase